MVGDNLSSFKKPALVGNLKSGSQTDIRDELLAKVRTCFRDFDNSLFVEDSGLESALLSKAKNGADLLIVYGGDGTALTAAKVAAKHDIPVLPLPGGTMNILHKTIYGDLKWTEIIEAGLSSAKVSWQPAGFINAHMFLVAAIVGTPAKLGAAREAARDNDILGTVQGIVSTLGALSDDDKFRYDTGDDNIWDANLLQITCPNMSEHASRADEFECVSMTFEDYSDLADLGVKAIATNWRNFEGAKRFFTPNISVTGREKTDVLCDGELHTMVFPLEITLRPKGFKVIML